MKKNTVILIVVLAVVALIVIWGVGVYNKMVVAEESVSGQWANVENQYQRRADLVPNLVATVKGYATHENETLENVVAARARATQMTINAESLTPETLQAYQATQGELSSALGRLLMVAEDYPDLKANQNFLELQSQLEGTENRIAVERNRFNETARAFNAMIRRFPNNFIAGIGGFDKKPYFEAQQGASTAPAVQF
jgi:LemA protein